MVNITARDVPGILGLNQYEDAWHILETKVENKHPFCGNKFCDHGIKYEKAAIARYETLTGNTVDIDQQNCRHPDMPWLTGRLDGVTQNKCIVEVKCPWRRRKEALSMQNVPLHYWVQCQVYMNIVDMEVTHYVEYYVKSGSPTDGTAGRISYIPINRDREWWETVAPKLKAFNTEMNAWLDRGSLKEHPVRIAQLAWESSFK
jgi:putative phage-type endonuclease